VTAKSFPSEARSFAFLKSVRTLMYYFVTALTAHPEPVPFDTALYKKILEEGRREIAAWGGNVTLVYWPDPSRYPGICSYSPALRQIYDHTRETVLNAAKEVNVPVIDLTKVYPDLPASKSGENAQYFYPYQAHMKPPGYHRAADAILAELPAISHP
jgi:hypothetical protein